MNLSRLFVISVMAGFVLAGPGSALAQWTPYEDFNGSGINPDKFHVLDTIGGASTPTAETLHVLAFGKLRQLIAQYGGVAGNTGRVTGAVRLPINDPTGITGLRAQVTVTRAEAQACAGNPDASRGHAEVIGRFFNDGTSTGPNDQTGDITASVRKVLDAVGGAVIEAGLFRCVDAACSSTSNVVPTRKFNTVWAINQPHTLTVQWDPANGRFLYSAKPGFGQEETVVLSYAGILPSDDDPPVVAGPDSLTLRALTANCGGARKRVLMDALFDDLMIVRD